MLSISETVWEICLMVFDVFEKWQKQVIRLINKMSKLGFAKYINKLIYIYIYIYIYQYKMTWFIKKNIYTNININIYIYMIKIYRRRRRYRRRLLRRLRCLRYTLYFIRITYTYNVYV